MQKPLRLITGTRRTTPVSEYKDHLSDDDSMTIGAFDGDKLVGIVTLQKETLPKLRHRATLKSVYVKPEYRGQKIAKKMIQKLIDICKSEGTVRKFYLMVMTDNEGAIQAYKKWVFIFLVKIRKRSERAINSLTSI
ncbi:GNAT family N-acetyltransferase [Sporolactobacillus sp. THM7-4]|nr:GNAT family N-acetyltransferase [Sporolactobacillus sp. THM7-4]